MSDLYELLGVHSEEIEDVSRHARQTKDPSSFVVSVLDLSDRNGRSLAVGRFGSEAVEHFSRQATARRKTALKVADITFDEMDRVACENISWLTQKNKTLPDSWVHIAAVSDGDFLFSGLFVPQD